MIQPIYRLKGHRSYVNDCKLLLWHLDSDQNDQTSQKGGRQPRKTHRLTKAISAGSDCQAIIWCLTTGKVCTRMLHKASVRNCSFAFDSSQNRLLVCTVCDIDSTQVLIWSMDGTHIDTVTQSEGILSLYADVETGDLLCCLKGDRVSRIQFGKHVALKDCTYGPDNVSIVSEDQVDADPSPFKSAAPLKINEDSDEIVVTRDDGVQVDLFTSQYRMTRALHFPQMRLAYTSGYDGTFKEFSLDDGPNKTMHYIFGAEHTFDCHSDSINAFDVEPRMGYAITASSDHTCFFLDIRHEIRLKLLAFAYAKMLQRNHSTSESLFQLVSNYSICRRIKRMLI